MRTNSLFWAARPVPFTGRARAAPLPKGRQKKSLPPHLHPGTLPGWWPLGRALPPLPLGEGRGEGKG